MSFIKLNDEHRNLLEREIAEFKEALSMPEYQTELKVRQKRIKYYQEDFPQRLTQLSESDVLEMVSNLWAAEFWFNKNAYAEKIISANGGINEVREKLVKFFSFEDPEKAYEWALKTIKHLGSAAITEILSYRFPNRCGIWNEKVRIALPILKLDNLIDAKKTLLSLEEYIRFNNLAREIANILEEKGFENANLLLVDLFFFKVSKKKKTGHKPYVEDGEESFDHDEIKELLAEIGNQLGFETKTEVPIAAGAWVDCVWQARIANLGLVQYVFEVHKSGSIDSLILNLQKAKRVPSVQRVVAVSNNKNLELIKRECEALPEEFRRALRFWPVSKVKEAAEYLRQVARLISEVDLIEQVYAQKKI